MSRKTLSTRAVDNRGRRLLASATLPHRGPDPGAGSLEAARVGWAMLVVGLLAVVAAAAGIVVPATHGTRTTADEPQYLLTAISLAEDGDLDIADELADGRWRPFHALPLPEQTEPLADGRRLSPHDPLLPLLLAGPVAAGGWVGAKLAMTAMAGLLAALALWTAVRRLDVPVATAALAVGVFACSPPLAVYGSQVYPELPAALAVLAAAAALVSPAAPGRRATLVVGGAVVALPWLGVKYAPVAAAIALVACWRLARAGQGRRALALAGSLAAAGVAFLVLHRWWYGGWTPYAAGDHFVGGELSVVGTEPDYLGRSRRLLGLLVGRGFGLAAWQPAWLLAVPAMAALARRRPPARGGRGDRRSGPPENQGGPGDRRGGPPENQGGRGAGGGEGGRRGQDGQGRRELRVELAAVDGQRRGAGQHRRGQGGGPKRHAKAAHGRPHQQGGQQPGHD